MSRKLAREVVMKYVYQMEINNQYKIDNLKYLIESDKISKSEISFIDSSLSSIIENLSSIDRIIESYLENWKMERIPKVDLSILRVAINEMEYREDIPDSVSINEAVDMAKEYSTEDSFKFINGVLGSYHRNKE